jgi:actin-related protein
MTQIMFETFNTPAMYVANAAVLPMYAAGISTGVAVVLGDCSFITPVEDCYVKDHAQTRWPLGGQKLTEHFERLLTERGYYPTDEQRRSRAMENWKEQLCYVALDYEEERKKPLSQLEKTLELPDGKVITVGSERFRCTEALFEPSVLGYDQEMGLAESVQKAVERGSEASSSTRRDMLNNVVLSGAGSLFKGLQERLQKDLSKLCYPKSVKVIAPVSREYSVWIGGSILASLSTFSQCWISKQEYDEVGPQIVHKKCTG